MNEIGVTASSPQGTWVLDPVAYTVGVGGRKVKLTPLEFRVLRYLMVHPGTITYQEILHNVWRRPVGDGENRVAVYIRRIRLKLEVNPAQPEHILTMRHHGYTFQP